MPRTTNRLTNTSATSGVTAPKKGRGAAKKAASPNSGSAKVNSLGNNSAKATETNASVSALKEVYQSLYSEFARLAEDARTKLAHVESLELALVQTTPFNLNHSSLDLPVEVQTASTNSNNSSNSSPEDSAETLVPRARKGGRPKSVASAATKPEATEAPKAKRGRQPKAATAKVEPETPRRRGGLKLVKPYQDSTMLDALERALEDRRGTTVSADTLVEALYGELKPEQFKLAKDRVTKSLSKGKIENRWDRVPDKIGCYTISMKLLEL